MSKRVWWVIIIGCGVLLVNDPLSALSRRSQLEQKRKKRIRGTFKISSPAFHTGEFIPALYTCDDQNISPELRWENPPQETKSFVLICHDPDDALAGSKIQWVVYDIPATVRALPKGVKATAVGAKLGLNSWGQPIYDGPCPPLMVHRYFFTLYALDIPALSFERIPTEREITEAMKGHILGKSVLLGKYQRTKSILTKAHQDELHTLV